MPADTTIRPARAEDVEAITAIYNDAVLHTTATFDTEPRTVADRAAPKSRDSYLFSAR